MKIVVLAGGTSTERDISIVSGTGICGALRKKGHQAILADKLGLSEKQLSHVTNSEPGSGLILFDNVVIPFVDKYPTDTKTYAIMNTKPEESVKQEDVG